MNTTTQKARFTNTLGATLQFRFSPEWRTEASFEPVSNCGIEDPNLITTTVSRQVGFDVFSERRY